MARHRQEFSGPEFKPQDAQINCERGRQSFWDTRNTPMPTHAVGMVYLDRIGPELFVGRYDHGKCPKIPEDAAEHDKHVKFVHEVRAIRHRHHAYIVSITPRGAESICVYCGATMEGCPGSKADLTEIPWDEPWEQPRRANQRELEAMDILPIPDNRLLYLDMMVHGEVWAGRMRIGECPHGGPHEAIVHWWRQQKEPSFSACVFCGKQWVGAPPGFWELVEPHPTIKEVLAKHAKDVRRGLY